DDADSQHHCETATETVAADDGGGACDRLTACRGGADPVVALDQRTGTDQTSDSGRGPRLCVALARRRFSPGVEARLPRRTIAVGNAAAVGESFGPLCRSGRAYFTSAGSGAAETDCAVHRGAERSGMAGVVRSCHRRSSNGGNAGADG